MRYSVLMICGIMFLCSCEAVVGGDGRVVSSDGNIPLEAVRVIIHKNDNPIDTTFSAEEGRFWGTVLAGCILECPEAKLIFEKSGFKTKTIVFDEEFLSSHGRYDFPRYVDSMVVVLEKN